MITEARLQQECFTWFTNTYRNYRGLLFMINNSGAKSAKEGAQSRAMGLVPGVPDLFLSLPNQTFHGFYIELKVGYNTSSPIQLKMQERLMKAGYLVEEVRTLETFKEAIYQYLN